MGEMEDTVQRLASENLGWGDPTSAKRDWIAQTFTARYSETPISQRLLIAISGIPGSGKTTFAVNLAARINQMHGDKAPGSAHAPIAAFVPLDGYHLSRAQLSAMSDPAKAHARRGAAFTFDDSAFLKLVEALREPLAPETKTIYAPSFDHAIKDPVQDDIPIPRTVRVVLFEGNYLSLNQGDWKLAASRMDELWFINIDFAATRKRLIKRHLAAGIAATEAEAAKRADENDLVNGQQILDERLDVQEIIEDVEDQDWADGD